MSMNVNQSGKAGRLLSGAALSGAGSDLVLKSPVITAAYLSIEL